MSGELICVGIAFPIELGKHFERLDAQNVTRNETPACLGSNLLSVKRDMRSTRL